MVMRRKNDCYQVESGLLIAIRYKVVNNGKYFGKQEQKHSSEINLVGEADSCPVKFSKDKYCRKN